MNKNRRNFLIATSVAFSGLLLPGCSVSVGRSSRSNEIAGTPLMDAGASILGPLRQDPKGILDLPSGFRYELVSKLGDTMSDGFNVPDRADGMGCFDIGNGELALVRNHELQIQHDGGGVIGNAYDTLARSSMPLPGGTTTLVLDAETLTLKRDYRSLAGTIRNCAGGTTPWGSWLSCEETVARAGGEINKDHGYVFEVPAKAAGLIDPVPLKAMGRFNHEAACVDPGSGIVYLTEDRDDALLYRFVPDTPGYLANGGTLQALALTGIRDARNWNGVRQIDVGQPIKGEWITLKDVDSPNDDLRARGAQAGATVFAREEGIYMGDGEFYFTATSGGLAGHGQVFKVVPNLDLLGKDSVELFFESASMEQYSYGDNLCVAPHGHLIVCEDQYTKTVNNYIRGITPQGQSYPIANLRLQTELAGACFSPDGKTLFVNVYSPTMTLAIQGPWQA